MVNKKGTRKAKATKNRQTHNDEPPKTHQKAVEELNQQSSIEDHVSMEEKHQVLKSLNDLIIEETTEKREEVDLLAQAKDTLEAELDRSNAEKNELGNELDKANHKLIELNVEADTNAIAVKNQLREMEDGVKRLTRESSDRESEIRVLKTEANEIMSKAKKRNTELETELAAKKKKIEGLSSEIKALLRNKDDLNSVNAEQKRKIAELQEKLTESEERLEKEKTDNKSMVEKITNEKNSEIEVLSSDKKTLEITKADQKSEIHKLKKTLEESNETVRNLQDQVVKLQMSAHELETELAAKKKKIEGFSSEIQKLLRNKDDMNSVNAEQKRNITELQEKLTESEERLEKEKTDIKSMVEKIIYEKNSEIEMLFSHNRILEIVKDDQKSEINELKKMLEASNETVRSLQDQTLELEVTARESMENARLMERQFDALAKTKSSLESRFKMIMEEKLVELSELLTEKQELEGEKRDQMWTIINLETRLKESEKNVKNSLIEESNLRNSIGTAFSEIERVKIERNQLVAAYADLKTDYFSLKSENDSLKKSLLDLKTATLDAPENDANGGRLSMLKNTASLLCQSENRAERLESQCYEIEIEFTKEVFKNKKETIEETKNEVEIMKQSLLQEQKKKKFWTFVSSVSTVVAVAASIAFARKTRQTPLR